MKNKNLYLVSVVLTVAAPAADIETAAAPENEAAAIYTNNPAGLLTSLSLSGCRVIKSNIKVINH